jgi:hypothetical protein
MTPYIIDFLKIGSPELGYITVAEAQKMFLLQSIEYTGPILHHRM